MLPSDILVRIAAGDLSLGGLEATSYHLAPGEKIGEATNRAWNRLQAAWVNFQAAREKLSATDAGTSITRERWLLPLFQLLDYGRLQTAKAEDVGGKSYPISHAWQQTPIHLVGCNVDLDHRIQTAAGGTRSSPHSLIQELLNRGDQHLWGIVSNGLRLRLLRDNVSLTRQAYVEFDLEAMMAGEAYPDFVLLWLLLHQSRFEAERPELCQLEKWSQTARTEGVRLLDGLRDGVQQAIEALGQGFLAHPVNTSLKDRLRSGALDKQDYYRQLLRLVYRLLFLFVAEDRDLLLRPDADPATRKRYLDNYATTRLRRLATARAGSRHSDLYFALQLVMDKLSDGCRELGLPALGSFLFSPQALPDLNGCEIANLHLLQAIRALAVTQTGQSRRAVDYKNLGAEEFGSVYESLLELHPELNAEPATFELKSAAGSERKKTGSYYTPTSLISCLLDSALDPVVEEAAKQPDPEAAILKLKIVDPACGSGHFLIAAAHRVAKRLAAVRTGEEEPPPEAQRRALRDVIGHCVYGIDINPMAAELCRVSLWIEALEPGKPLSFLEHHIQCGNSLLGATPALLAKGIPDEAFTAIEGDDNDVCKEFKRINKDEHKQQMRLFAATTEPWHQLGNFAASMTNLDGIADDSIEGIREKQRLYEAAIRSGDYLNNHFWADAWCAAFVWKKTREFKYPITEEVFRRIERNPNTADEWMQNEVERLARHYQFFHWHLAFPDVFHVPSQPVAPENAQAGWNGGFDCVLGNPPWDKVELLEREWFGQRCPEIASCQTAAKRKKMIDALANEDPDLFAKYKEAVRTIDGQRHFMRDSGRFVLCSAGRTNLYAVFAESNRDSINPKGRVGCIVPSGIATDDSTKQFFKDLLTRNQLVSLYDFENGRGIFPDVQGNVKFCLLTLVAGGCCDFEVAAQVDDVTLLAAPGTRYRLSIKDVERINPNTFNAPTFSDARNAELNKFFYRRFGVLVKEGISEENAWNLRLRQGLFNMTSDSGEFRTGEELLASGFTLTGNCFFRNAQKCQPLSEAKLVFQYDHRAATFAGTVEADRYNTHAGTKEVTHSQHSDPDFVSLPRFWVSDESVEREAQGAKWFLVFRDIISAVADARSLVATIVPRWGIGNTMPIVDLRGDGPHAALLLAYLNSFVTDYLLRQKASGSHLNFYIFKQLPSHPPATYSEACPWMCETLRRDWILPRVLELCYTAWDLQPFAEDCAWSAPPFQWNEERRYLLRCELDAAAFSFCLPTESNDDWRPAQVETAEDVAQLKASFPSPRHAVAHIMDTFPIVKRRDEEKWGEYRTKRIILEIYDAMAEAIRTGQPYQSRLDPPPADPSCRHPKKKIGILAFGSLIADPGEELQSKISMRIKTKTPFPVEYARISGKTRGGAPTLIPHPDGSSVPAEILVLDDDVSIETARDLLWRRETRKIDTDEHYAEGTTANSVLIQKFHDAPCVSTVLYTDFPPAGKLEQPTAKDLASRAIQSVQKAEDGKDGISYLIAALASGIETPLTQSYRDEIIEQTDAMSLEQALQKAKELAPISEGSRP
jgi:hypothetical protein